MRPARLALLPLLLLLTPPTFAAERYEVEVVIFEQAPGGGPSGERWPAQVAVPDFKRARALNTGAAGARRALAPSPDAFAPLSLAEARLAGAVQRLENSSRYQLLRHLRWRQPALEPGESVPIRVNAGRTLRIRSPQAAIERPAPAAGNSEATTAKEAEDAEDDPPSDASEVDAGTRAGLRTAEGNQQAPQMESVAVQPLDGTIELVVSRYLHVHADLYYTTDIAWDRALVAGYNSAQTQPIARGPDGQSMLSFPLRQQRRMRSGELHYLDHPVLGLLVLVTPVESAS
jgi:hypothetical protein